MAQAQAESAGDGARQGEIERRAKQLAQQRGAAQVEERDREAARAELTSEDPVEEASQESFPASDPPAWAGHPHPTPDEEPSDD